jgi:hypothetical protein
MRGAVAGDRRESTLADGVQLPLLGLGVWQVPNGRECVDAVRWALEMCQAQCTHMCELAA